jgi:hypothetical protein
VAQFVYLIPGLSGPASPEQAEAAGLGYAFPRGQSMHVAGDSETEVGCGALVSAESKALKFKRGELNWIRIGAAWLGFSKEKSGRPKPRDLQRSDAFVDGHPIPLGDGNDWTIPVIRFAEGNSALPSVLMRKDDGSYGYDVRAEYRGIVSICDMILDNTMKGEGFRLSAEMTMAFVQGVLSVNYRVSEAEISALELIDTRNVKQIAQAAMDVPSMLVLLDELKKKLQAGPSVSGPGCVTGERE